MATLVYTKVLLRLNFWIFDISPNTSLGRQSNMRLTHSTSKAFSKSQMLIKMKKQTSLI